MLLKTGKYSWGDGMNSSEDNSSFKSFSVKGSFLFIQIDAKTTLKRHKSISKRLAKTTAAQLARFEILGDGEGVHWPLLDEDISADFLINYEKYQANNSKKAA